MPIIYKNYAERKKAEADKINRVNNLELGDEIKKSMKSKNMTYDDICRSAKISYGTLSKVLHDPHNAKLSTIRAVCYSLGMVIKVVPINLEEKNNE